MGLVPACRDEAHRLCAAYHLRVAGQLRRPEIRKSIARIRRRRPPGHTLSSDQVGGLGEPALIVGLVDPRFEHFAQATEIRLVLGPDGQVVDFVRIACQIIELFPGEYRTPSRANRSRLGVRTSLVPQQPS